MASFASAHMPDRPDLDDWFMKLRSPGGGLCCDFTEARKLTDVQWDTQDGHYRVFIDNKWFPVKDDAVVPGPNKYGQAMAWPLEYTDSTGHKQMYGVRCFMPGAGG